MSKNELEKLKELALRGLLDDEKERRLRMYIETDPSCAIPDIDKEILLGKLLRNLPKAPVSSNFTARVMSEIERLETEPVIPIARPTVLDWLLERLVRKLLELKIAEYQSLPPNERQLRLFMTELRWYLVTLLKTDPISREMVMEQIPPEYKPLIRERLAHWEKLPSDIQKELLANEYALHFILRITNETPAIQQKVISTLHPQQQTRILQVLNEWNKMPDERKKTITDSFRRLFELSESEQNSALRMLPPAERVRMENALKAFSNLPPEDKKRCIESFKKFATMSDEQREQFLKNAMRWIEMSPEERKAWRDIVRSMQSKQIPDLPPLPPGMIHDATAAVHSSNLKTN